MSIADAIGLALRNLAQARLRTTLTVLGVAIGIASLSGMVSLAVGLETQLVGRFTESGVFDTITVTPSFAGQRGGLAGRGRRGGGQALATPDMPAAETARAALDDDAVERISAIAHVQYVGPNLRVPVQLTLDGHSEFTTAAGVPQGSAGKGPFQTILYGRFFADDESPGCMLSLDMARRLTTDDPQNLIGKMATIGYAAAPSRGDAPDRRVTPPATAPGAGSFSVTRVDAPCSIVGIVERESMPGLGGANVVSALMIPLARAKAIDAVQVTNAQSLLRPPTGLRAYQSLSVRVSAPRHTQDVQRQIEGMGYSAFSLNDALQGAKRAFLILDIVLFLIGSIALSVASLGIMNTMVMSILERTREIGIMKAIGGDDRDIRRIFLIEASAIGAIGGVAGVALGWLVGRAINFGANSYIQSQGGTSGELFALPFWLIAGALAFSTLLSLAAGSYPARRAARLDPILALRHD